MDTLRWVLQLLLFAVFFWIIKRFQKKKARVYMQKENILEHGKILKVFSVIILLLGMTILIFFPLLGGIPATMLDWLSFSFVVALFLGLGVVLCIEAFLSKVFFNNEQIRKESLWTKNHSVKWENIIKISHSNLLGWYVLESNGGKKIRVSDMMNGLESFLKETESRRPDLIANNI